MRMLSLLSMGLVGFLAPFPSVAQAPADNVLRDFLPIGGLLLVVDDMKVPEAEILRSDRAAAFLVISPTFVSPVLLSPRRRVVETVDLMKVSRATDGTVDLLADAVLAPAGSFRLEEGEVHFEVGAQQARLIEKPPLLGLRKADELADYNPEYGRIRDSYQPQSSVLQRLSAAAVDVEVRVYFGSWCPHCTKSVPKLMKVEGALGEGRIAFAYYGLPKDMGGDSEATRLNISGVPTGIVFRGGEEIGRITGGGWRMPEISLQTILTSSPSG